MQIFYEISKIAYLNEEISRLVKKLSAAGLDTESMDFDSARFVSKCTEENGHLMQNNRQLDNMGLIKDQYYAYEESVTGEDDAYGIAYFKSDIPGNFLAIPFQV